MKQYITVQPAYGRDYTTQKAVREDWNAGKDFQIVTMGPDDGRYMSKRDLTPDMVVTVRYARLTKTWVASYVPAKAK